MDSKSQSAYTSVLLQIRARLIQWNFTLAVSDYEDAIINSIEAVFGVEVQGCYFHYVNVCSIYFIHLLLKFGKVTKTSTNLALFKPVQDLCLRAKTTLTPVVLTIFPQVHQIIRLTCALPLLPQHLLQRGMDAIRMEAVNQGLGVFNLALPFLDYVQFDWILHVNRGRTLSVCGSEHRTNNAR